MSDNKIVAQVNSFDDWLLARPKWLQTATSKIIKKKAKLSDIEINEMADLCVSEILNVNKDHFQPYTPGLLTQATVKTVLRLVKLTDVQGVNALNSPGSLDFGKNQLTVVYGSNGAGKSGYARLLKNMCGARNYDKLLNNVYSEEKIEMKASAHFTINDGENIEAIWTLDTGPCRQLKNIQIFDSSTALSYVTNKNPAAYEPGKIRFIRTLIELCDDVSKILTTQRDNLVDQRPRIPDLISNTSRAEWNNNVSAKTTQKQIDENCIYNSEMNEERVTGEATLLQTNIPERLKNIQKTRQSLKQIAIFTESIKNSYSDNTLSSIISCHLDASKKRKAAQDAAQKLFSNAPLDGVGLETWIELWEQARKYSNNVAYKSFSFPNTKEKSRCVLCQQELNEEAKSRLNTFELYIKDSLEKNANQAEQQLRSLSSKLVQIPDYADWNSRLHTLKINDESNLILIKALKERRDLVLGVDDVEKLPKVDWKIIDNSLTEMNKGLNLEENALQQLQTDQGRQSLIIRINELKAAQWLSQNKKSIVEEVERLKSVALLTKALSLAKTNQLSSKSNSLSQELISDGYRERFSNELSVLGGKRLKVRPRENKKGKGETTFDIELVDAVHSVSPSLILSEGESRIVALAAFLADMTGENYITPFVFDDPISSLDQDYEERVIKRLIDLSENRQVIIFTHRLSLVALVEDEIKKRKTGGLGKPINHDVITLQSFAGRIGMHVPGNIRSQQPKKALNMLLNDSLPRVKKAYDKGDVEVFDSEIKSLCSNLRIMVERCVETILLSEVVVRFRRSVMTGNKLMSLTHINSTDCQYIENLMSRYSVFEHSQPDELPDKLPDVDLIEQDLNELIQWIDNFEARKKSN
ncbi:AAA family ATPase [Pantoea agglomerans]|uniref:Restriction endonuclease n=1 Tax=Enterobacter agglomerans TaxID=549 RepID=A0ACC5RHZ9_ENTAG|nr:AAA family ATPase [Pantoea agglomerans]MBK4724341.1 restriction endonuclease [Pantoea agglomerans]